jgi:hypothetical protein
MFIDLVLDTWFDAKEAYDGLKGTFALTLIRQVPLVAGLAVMVGVAAH